MLVMNLLVLDCTRDVDEVTLDIISPLNVNDHGLKQRNQHGAARCDCGVAVVHIIFLTIYPTTPWWRSPVRCQTEESCEGRNGQGIDGKTGMVTCEVDGTNLTGELIVSAP